MNARRHLKHTVLVLGLGLAGRKSMKLRSRKPVAIGSGGAANDDNESRGGIEMHKCLCICLTYNSSLVSKLLCRC